MVIDAITDPEISPFPEHVMMKNIQHLASSVSKGDKAALQHTGHILREKVDEKVVSGKV